MVLHPEINARHVMNGGAARTLELPETSTEQITGCSE